MLPPAAILPVHVDEEKKAWPGTAPAQGAGGGCPSAATCACDARNTSEAACTGISRSNFKTPLGIAQNTPPVSPQDFLVQVMRLCLFVHFSPSQTRAVLSDIHSLISELCFHSVCALHKGTETHSPYLQNVSIKQTASHLPTSAPCQEDVSPTVLL